MKTLKIKKSYEFDKSKNIAMIAKSDFFVKKILPEIRDVDIKFVSNDFTGCQKMLAVNDNYVKPKFDDFCILDCEEFDFNTTTDYRKLGRLTWP